MLSSAEALCYRAGDSRCTADGGATATPDVDPDDRVGVIDDDGIRDFFPGLLAETVAHDGVARCHVKMIWPPAACS